MAKDIPNGSKNKSAVVILISEKLDFKTKTITSDREGHNIMIKRSIQKVYITILNI